MWSSVISVPAEVAYSAISARKQYSRTMRLQRQAQDWAEYMSNSSHQREVADLRKAGMNPILTATGGNGASWSSPSAGTAQKADSVDISGSLSDLINADAAEKNADTTAKAQASQSDVNKSQVELNKANTALAAAKAAKEGATVPAFGFGGNILNKAIKSFGLLTDKNTWNGIFGSNSAKDSRGNGVGKSGGHGSGSTPIIEIRKGSGVSSKQPLRMSWDDGKTWYTKTTKGWKR